MQTIATYNPRTMECGRLTFYEESDVPVGGEFRGRLKLVDGWYRRRVRPTKSGKCLIPTESPVGRFATIVRSFG